MAKRSKKEKRKRAAAHVQLPRAQLQVGPNQFRFVAFDAPGFCLHWTCGRRFEITTGQKNERQTGCSCQILQHIFSLSTNTQEEPIMFLLFFR